MTDKEKIIEILKILDIDPESITILNERAAATILQDIVTALNDWRF